MRRRCVQKAAAALCSPSEESQEARPAPHGACRNPAAVLAARRSRRVHIASKQRLRRRFLRLDARGNPSSAPPNPALREALRWSEKLGGAPQFWPLPASVRRSDNGTGSATRYSTEMTPKAITSRKFVDAQLKHYTSPTLWRTHFCVPRSQSCERCLSY